MNNISSFERFNVTSRRNFLKRLTQNTSVVAFSSLLFNFNSQKPKTHNITKQTSPFPDTWIHGSPDCMENYDSPYQVFQYNLDTYILRQNKCFSWEAPFLYLFIGEQQAILLDTGDMPRKNPEDYLRTLVESLLPPTKSEPFDLIIAHTHGHADHIQGDTLFRNRPNTSIVPTGLKGVQMFFGFKEWPTETTEIDLGNRMLTIIAVPGHTRDHIAIYDHKTRFLMTGDTLYPGNLYIRFWPEYQRSVNRLADFAENHEVSYVLGNHIEMTREPGVLFPIGSIYQPDEHALQLNTGHLMELRDACNAMGNNMRHDIHDDFIIVPRG